MADRDAEIARAHQAARLLDDPLYRAAWEALVARADDALLRGPCDAPEALMRARRERDWLMELKAAFERHVRAGRLAERERDGH